MMTKEYSFKTNKPTSKKRASNGDSYGKHEFKEADAQQNGFKSNLELARRDSLDNGSQVNDVKVSNIIGNYYY